jgi:hypothetical protein
VDAIGEQRRPTRRRRRVMTGARRRAGTTPGHLRTLSLAVGAMATVLLVVGCASLSAASLTVTGIQQRNVPAIIGMARVRAWLVDADRSAANAYLAGSTSGTLDQLQFDAESAATNVDPLGRLSPDDPQMRYEADIAAASHGLQTATQQNPADDQAIQRLQAVAASVATYTQLVQTADGSELQDPVAGTLYLEAASNSMHSEGGILAQVDAVRALYVADLGGANLTLRITAWMLALYAVAAVVLLGLLVNTQRFLRARFRRRRNMPLLAATSLLVMLSVGGGAGAVQASQSVRTGEGQTYARLTNLWNARALAYEANGMEALSLIAYGADGQLDQRFQADAAQLVDPPLTDQLMQGAERGEVRFNGLLADELRAASSAPEREAALQALRAWRQFLLADATVRATAAKGRLKGPATVASIPYQDLVSAFSQLDWYLGASIQILQRQFDATMQSAEATLGVTAAFEALAVAIAALTFRGLQPRIEEYTAGVERQR